MDDMKEHFDGRVSDTCFTFLNTQLILFCKKEITFFTCFRDQSLNLRNRSQWAKCMEVSMKTCDGIAVS